jgi:hypothetical protein
MKRFEYKIVDCSENRLKISRLNELGAEGWELCDRDFPLVIFKREIEMKRIEKDLTVNIDALKTWGRYHDTILVSELGAYISLTVIAEKRNMPEGGCNIGVEGKEEG